MWGWRLKLTVDNSTSLSLCVATTRGPAGSSTCVACTPGTFCPAGTVPPPRRMRTMLLSRALVLLRPEPCICDFECTRSDAMLAIRRRGGDYLSDSVLLSRSQREHRCAVSAVSGGVILPARWQSRACSVFVRVRPGDLRVQFVCMSDIVSMRFFRQRVRS
jgi:hypothetical protein